MKWIVLNYVVKYLLLRLHKLTESCDQRLLKSTVNKNEIVHFIGPPLFNLREFLMTDPLVNRETGVTRIRVISCFCPDRLARIRFVPNSELGGKSNL